MSNNKLAIDGQFLKKNVTLMLNKKCSSSNDIIYLGQQDVKEIRRLYLNYNKIAGKDLLGLVKGDWCNLTTLHLSSNMLGDIGCKYLTIINLKQLKSLDLEQNNITTTGIMHLCKLNSDLTFLILSRNRIGFGCGKWLNSIRGLQILKLRNNKLSKIDLMDIILTNQNIKDLEIQKKELIEYKYGQINKEKINEIFNQKFRENFFMEY